MLSVAGCVLVEQPRVANPEPKVTPVDHAIERTVVLLDKRNSGEWSRPVCAGVRIGPSLLLTAHHCAVAGAWSANELAALELAGVEPPVIGREMRFVSHTAYNGFRMDEDEQVSAVVAASDAKHDVSVLITSDVVEDWSPVRKAAPKVDEAVFTVGHPSGFLYHMTRGRIGHPQRRMNGGWFSHVDITIWFGNSGGGLFDDDGCVVGIASAISSPSSAFYVHTDAIRDLLKDLSKATLPTA